MGTKNNPGQFDCYDAALPDEPMFVLLARDPDFALRVRKWAFNRQRAVECGERPLSDMELVREAIECASAGANWRRQNMGAWRTPPVNGGDEERASLLQTSRDTGQPLQQREPAKGTPIEEDEPNAFELGAAVRQLGLTGDRPIPAAALAEMAATGTAVIRTTSDGEIHHVERSEVWPDQLADDPRLPRVNP